MRYLGITDLATVDDLFLQVIIDELTPEELQFLERKEQELNT